MSIGVLYSQGEQDNFEGMCCVFKEKILTLNLLHLQSSALPKLLYISVCV